jgi:hypothetical protein
VPDTVVIEPPPPTLRDEASDLPPTMAEPPPRRGAWRVVVALIAALALVSGSGWAYLHYLRFEPIARRHVPSNANFAARVDLVDVALFRPVREHLLPVLEEELARPGGAAKKTLGDRLADATGVRLDRDLREIVIASVDATSWVVVAAGPIERGRFVDGLAKVLDEERIGVWTRAGELLVGPGGVAIGQADDGALVLATDAAIARTALPASDDARALGLPTSGALAFAATDLAWSGASGKLPGPLAAAKLPSGVARASGTFQLGDAPSLEVRLEPRPPATAEDLARDTDNALRTAGLVLLLGPDLAGARAALQGSKVEATGGAAVVRAPWPYEGLDRAVKDLAQTVRALRGTSPPGL